MKVRPQKSASGYIMKIVSSNRGTSLPYEDSFLKSRYLQKQNLISSACRTRTQSSNACGTYSKRDVPPVHQKTNFLIKYN